MLLAQTLLHGRAASARHHEVPVVAIMMMSMYYLAVVNDSRRPAGRPDACGA